MHVFKILVLLNSSVNYYIYRLKRILSNPDRLTGCCLPHKNRQENICLHTIEQNKTEITEENV